MKTVLDLAQMLPPTPAHSRVLSYYGEMAFYHNDMQTARDALQKSLKQCDELNILREHTYTQYRLSFYYYEQDDMEMAFTCLHDAEHISRNQNYKWELAHIL